MTAESQQNDHNNAPIPASRSLIIPIKTPKNAVTAEEIDLFLKTYASTGLWNHSARTAGRFPQTFRDMRREDPVFEERVQQAKSDYVEFLEMEAHRKAIEGELETTYDKNGNVIRERRITSDRMHEVLLRANAPEKYRDNVNVDPNIIAGVLIVERPAKSHEEWMRRFAGAQAVGEQAKQEYLAGRNEDGSRHAAAPETEPSESVKGNS
jgi:hypothetical protein